MSHAELCFRQGNVLAEQGYFAQAVCSYQEALHLAPHQPALLNNLGRAYVETGCLEEAEKTFEAFTNLSPENAEAWNNLAVVVQMRGELETATHLFRKALALNPKYAEAWYNLGFALEKQCHWDDAIVCNRRAIAIRPEYAEAHFNLAMLLILTEKMAEGWREYEWRWETKGFSTPKRILPQPLWDGSPLQGKTLFLDFEQGAGDIFQMLRYVPLLKQRCGTLMVVAPSHLRRILQSVQGIDIVKVDGEKWGDFAAHVPIMSLPRILATDLDSIPDNIPYVFPEPELVADWKKLVHQGDSFKIGLVWAGNKLHKNDLNRSCRLRDFAPLAAIGNISWYSLQLGEPGDQLVTNPEGMSLIDLTGSISDYADTAALIANLDLVISVDTSVAHLAGAMGKPVWVLLPHSPDWRWMLNRSDSPWYPTMRLFRQESPGDWAGVAAQVRNTLELLLENRLKLYFYRPDVDYFLPPLLQAMEIPLLYPNCCIKEQPAETRCDVLSMWAEDEQGRPVKSFQDNYEKVESPDEADFIVFPQRIDELLENFGGEGAARYLRQLPLFAEQEEKHVFLTVHDNCEPLGIKSVLFRAGAAADDADPFTYAFPYRTEDFSKHLHFDWSRIAYHTSFVGFTGSCDIRARLMTSIIREQRLVSYIDSAEKFYGHLDAAELARRRALFVEYLSRSLTVLCPRGTGINTFRFFETMSMGRIPVLISDNCRLPFADEIDYDAFTFRIAERDVEYAGQILYEWLSPQSKEELLHRCRSARLAWEQHCRFSRISLMLLQMLWRHKEQRQFNQRTTLVKNNSF